MKSKNRSKGFSLVELMVVVAIIGILSGAAYFGIQRARSWNMNDKMMDDLIAISNALEQYKQDHFGSYPVPNPGGNMNVLCFSADAIYVHDCASASFREGMIDNNLLGKRYLQEVPTDPRTGSRYVYGVSNDGKYFMVAGDYEEDSGGWTARTTDNLSKGFALPSLIRAFDGPNFVMDKGPYLPYSPDYLVISARLDNVNGEVRVNGLPASSGLTVLTGDKITTADDGTADIYFSDGSVSHLDKGSELTVKADSAVTENTATNIITKIKLLLGKGRIWSKVVRLASKSEFSIETTTAIAGVRGTEFGIDADTNIVAVKSGEVWVAEDKPANTVAAGEKAGLSPSGPVGTAPATDADFNSLGAGFESGLSPIIVPWITGGIAHPNGVYDVFVTFNGLSDPGDTIPFDGLQVFSNSQTHGYKVMKEGALDHPVLEIPKGTGGVLYDAVKKTYRFALKYTTPDSLIPKDINGPESILVRAYQGTGTARRYSSLSWPPTGFYAAPPATDTPMDFTNVLVKDTPSLRPAGLIISAPPEISLTASGAAVIVPLTVKLEDPVPQNQANAAVTYALTASDSAVCSIPANSPVPIPDLSDPIRAITAQVQFTSAGDCVITATASGLGEPVTAAITIKVLAYQPPQACPGTASKQDCTLPNDPHATASQTETCLFGSWSFNGVPCVKTGCRVGYQNTTTAGVQTCTAVSVCGNGIKEAGEDCDDSGATVTGTCSYGQPSCTVCDSTCHLVSGIASFCGDARIDTAAGEKCDDGTALNGQYGHCNATCTGPGPHCGDGVVNGSEQCDGNAVACLTGTVGQASCNSDCTFNYSACESVLLVKCVGSATDSNRVATTPTGSFKNSNRYFKADTQECWILGDPGLTCTQACSAISGLNCDTTGNWNDTTTCSICDFFDATGPLAPAPNGCLSSTSPASPYYHPLFDQSHNQCFYRTNSVNSSCGAPVPSTRQRVCKCQPIP